MSQENVSHRKDTGELSDWWKLYFVSKHYGCVVTAMSEKHLSMEA